MSEDDLAAIQTPRSTNDTGDHSRIGSVTSYQAKPSDDTGPRVIATIVPALSVPSFAAFVSGPLRYDRPSSTTRPNPPVASEGEASQVAPTFHEPALPLRSIARTRNA